jgi:hypothetical protein
MKLETEQIFEAENVLRSCLSDIPFVQVLDIQREPSLSTTGIQPDLTAVLMLPSGKITLILEYKSNGQPRIVRGAIKQIEMMVSQIPNSYGVFAAPYISPDSGEILTENNIGYLDLAGNCRLSFWPVYIRKDGQKNPYASKRGLRSLYFARSLKTGMILRILLENPNQFWKTKELADKAQASFGQIANVKKQLGDREWIESDKKGFRLKKPQALLMDWSKNYSIKQHKAHEYYSLMPIPEIESKLADFCSQSDILYGFTGFSGAARLAPYVKYQRVTAYIEESGLINEIADTLKFSKVSSGANVSLILPDSLNVFYGVKVINGENIISPVQIYLDLMNMPARGEEAAEHLLRSILEIQWQ